MIEALLVFLFVFINDILWVFYMLRVAQRRKLTAALFGSVIYLFSALAVLSYTENKLMIIPAVLGAFAGTWIAITIDEIFSNNKLKD